MAGENILIIEDERDLARLMGIVMQGNGYQTSVAYNGADGLRLALCERPDLILLDVRLPEMDGMQVLHNLREHQVDVPVVVVTAWGSEELVVEALRLGVKDYIKKPFPLSELREVVERALTEGRLRRERDQLTRQLTISNRELEQRVRQLTALYEVGQALGSTLDLDELLEAILREASRVLEINVASILLLDQETGELVFRLGTGNRAELLVGRRLASGQGIAGWVAHHGEPLLVQDVHSDPRFSPVFDEITGITTESILCVPLMTKGHVTGVVEALNKPRPGFAKDDLAMLRSLAAAAAVAIENAQLFEESRHLHQRAETQLTETTRAYSEIQALQETTGALLSSLDLQNVLNQIVNGVVSGLGYNGAMLAEYEEENDALTVRAVAVDPALGESSIIKAGEEMAGLSVVGAAITMDQDENLAVRSALTGKIEVTHHFFDLVRPQVPQDVAETIQAATGIQTLATIPLLAKGHLAGNLFAGSSRDEITETELESLRTFANQAALAIENARLYQNLRESRDQVTERSQALEKRLNELSRLQQMAMELSKVTIGANLRDIFGRVTEHAAALLEAESSAILLFDHERQELVCQEPAFGVPLDVVRDWHVPLSKDSPAWVAWESGGPLIVNDVAEAPIVKMMGLEEIQARMGLRATIFSVLRVGGQPIGVLQVSDKQDDSDFTPDDARVLEIFSSQSAIAIENARILQRMEALTQVGETVTARLTLPEVLERVMQGVNELIEVKGVSIWLKEPAPDGQDAQLSLVASFPEKMENVTLAPGEGIAGWVAQEGQALIVHDVQKDPRYSHQVEEMLGFVTESILCVPLQVRDEISGVIEVVNKVGSRFDQEDLEILNSVAASVAVAVENARLFGNEQRRASEMEALVEIAQAVTEAVTERPRALLERIARGACEALEADCAIVYPFVASQPDMYDLTTVAAHGTQHPLELSDSKMTADDPTRVVRRRRLLVCEDVACDRPALLQDPFFERESIRSFTGVLLKADEDELGVLYVGFRAPHRFEERELTSVRLIAHQAALAIAKSRLFQTLNRDLVQANAELRRRVQELEELQTINNMISATLDIDRVWDRILQGAMSITGAPNTSILLLDEESGSVIAHVRQGDETYTKSFDPRATLVLPSVSELEAHTATFQGTSGPPVGETPWVLIHWQLIPDARSVRHTPIVSGSEKEPIGILVISSPELDAFGPDDLRLLETLANQASIAIQNARYLQELRAYQERQVEAERMAAMADIATNMVHRLNNTIGVIRPFTQQIEGKLDRGDLTDDYLRSKLHSIQESADRTLEVARQIRRPFRPIQPEPIDVNECIATAQAELTPPVGVQVHIQPGVNLPPVEATRQLEEVFRNLMRNALDAMADTGGVLTVRSRRINDRLVIVTVTDTGPGIPLEMQDKVFNIGTTTKRGGMGFGLWWSRTFLRRLGGNIMVKSEEGQGCTFTVTLPIREA